MKEHPILFSTELIPKILDGTKTMTRRAMKPQPHIERGVMRWQKPHKGGMHGIDLNMDDHADLAKMSCPYGQVGDMLWVRETHKFTSFGFAITASVVYKDGATMDVTKVITDGTTVYNEDCPEIHKWRPSLFMPRWASRIERIISLLRAERLRDISEADALAEGGYTIEEFIRLYLRLNHLPEGANPWNWVIGW